MATSGKLRLFCFAAATTICVAQVPDKHLYEIPPQPPAVDVGAFAGLQQGKDSGKQLAELVSQMGQQSLGAEPQEFYSRPQYYADPAHYMAEFARSIAAPGASPAQSGRLASIGGSAASFAAASNLQELRGGAEGWRRGHEDLEQAISSLRKYLEKSADQDQLVQPPQAVLLQQQQVQPQLQQEPRWEAPRRESALPLPEQSLPALSYDLSRPAPRPDAALLELGSTPSTASSLERAFETVVARHPGFMMVSSVVFGITLALCCILNRSRLERGRQQLSEEPGQAAGVFFFLLFASSGFGLLWGYGLIQPYWKPLLVGGYVLLTFSWFAWLVGLQMKSALMEPRPAPKSEAWKLPWTEAGKDCEAACEAVPQKRKDP